MGSGCFGHRLNKTQLITTVLLAIILFAIAGDGLCAQGKAGEPAYRSMIRKLRHIDAEDAKQMLNSLGVGGDVSRLANTNALIITTSDSTDQVKAMSILSLIDSKVRYETTKLATNVKADKMPHIDSIDMNVKGIRVGSFTSPPFGNDVPLAIVDVHKGDIVAITPRGLVKPVSAGFAKARKNFIENKNKNSRSNVFVAGEKARAADKDDKAKDGETDESKFAKAFKEFKRAEKELADARVKAKEDIDKELEQEFEEIGPVNASLAEKDFLSSGFLDAIEKAEERAKNKGEEKKTPEKDNSQTEPQDEEEKPEAVKPKPQEKKPEAKESKPEPKQVAPKQIEPKEVTPAETKQSDDKNAAADSTSEKTKPSTDRTKSDAAKSGPTISKVQNSGQEDATLQALMKLVNSSKESEQPREAVKETKPEPKPVDKPSVKVPEPKEVEKEVETKTEKKDEKKAEAARATFPIEFSDKELETTITLPTKVEIPDLLKLVGVQLGLNYMYDPVKVKGEVTLFLNDGKIKVRELYELVESVLKFRGFVMTRSGKLVTVVPHGEAPDIDPVIIRDNSDIKIGDVVVTRIFNLKNIETDIAEEMLKQMKLGLSIQSIPENSTMIITGYAYRMKRIQDVLDMIDLPGKKRIFRDRILSYTTPEVMAAKVDALAQELDTISITVNSETIDTSPTDPKKPMSRAEQIAEARRRAQERARGAAGQASSTTLGSASSKGVYLDIDERTNRILMIGLEKDIKIVEELIDTLDVPQQSLRTIKQYRIENIDAGSVIDILSELGVASGSARPAASTPTRGAPRTPVPTTRGEDPDGPQISLLMSTNSLLINATPEQHEQIITIIAHVDVTNPDERTIKEYEIKRVDTTEVIQTLGDLGIISQQSGRYSNSRHSTTSRSSARPGAPSTGNNAPATPAVTAPSSFSEPLADEPQVAILETTNSLLINATPKQHASIAMVVAHVDRELEESSTPYLIYPLQNQDPEELKPLLDELVNATIAAKTQSPQGQAGAPTTTAKIQTTTPSGGGLRREDERITIVADKETYSLVVYASKKNQLWIGELIENLDQYRPQVLLDVTLVEITKDDIFNMDLDLVTKAAGLAPGGSMESPLSAITSTFTDNVFEARTTSKGNPFGQAFYGDKHVQALLNLMDKKGYGRVLARPSILVKDNQPGEIKTEKTIYIAQEKTSFITGSGDTGNLSKTSDVIFTDYKSGVELLITPHISSKDVLQLDISLNRTDFDKNDDKEVTIGDKKVPKPLNTISSNVVTTAVLPNGATIILGGIESINQGKTVSKVPILGDIPLIGLAFRGLQENNTQSKLYVFVKAHIIRPGDELTGRSDIERVSSKKRKAFEDAEKEFQGLHSVPGVKPNPVQPERILEDDEYLKKIKANSDNHRAVIEVYGKEEDSN